MKKFLCIAFGVTTVVASLVGCRKSEDYVPEPYSCECGSMTWEGGVHTNMDANYMLLDTTAFFSRRYFVTADIVDTTNVAKSISMTLDLPSVLEVIYLVNDTTFDFSALIYERDDSDSFQEIKTYVPIEGSVTIDPALAGGRESLSFDMMVRELNDGDTIGPMLPFSGSFNVIIGNN
jgi:hypothetical protein